MSVASRATSGPDGKGGPHVFVEDLEQPRLGQQDQHHLRRVLRLQTGDNLTVCDGVGSWRPCVLGNEPEPAGEVRTVPCAEPALTVAVALVKGERPEWIVQKLTELGIDRIGFFSGHRSVVRWDEAKAQRNAQRLTEVARAAAMQSRRVWLPEITTLRDYATAAALRGAARCERGGGTVTLSTPTLLIGPEGGWSEEERAEVLPVVGLADLQLRVETAAVAAGVVLAALRSGRVSPG